MTGFFWACYVSKCSLLGIGVYKPFLGVQATTLQANIKQAAMWAIWSAVGICSGLWSAAGLPVAVLPEKPRVNP